MFRTFAIAVAALGATAAVTAPAMADQYCGPGYYYRYGECRPYHYTYPPAGVVGSAVISAGYVAGSAVNAAGNVAGSAVNAAGNIVGCALGGCR